MQLRNNVRNFLIDEEYYIDIYDHYIHIFHYIDIEKLTNEQIILRLKDFKLHINGSEFRVQKLLNGEILIRGILNKLEIER